MSFPEPEISAMGSGCVIGGTRKQSLEGPDKLICVGDHPSFTHPRSFEVIKVNVNKPPRVENASKAMR